MMKFFYENGKNSTYLDAANALDIDPSLFRVQFKAIAKKGYVTIEPKRAGAIAYTAAAIRFITHTRPARLSSLAGIKDAFWDVPMTSPTPKKDSRRRQGEDVAAVEIETPAGASK